MEEKIQSLLPLHLSHWNEGPVCRVRVKESSISENNIFAVVGSEPSSLTIIPITSPFNIQIISLQLI